MKCICSFLMKNDDSSSYEWIYGIIILHFLNGDIKPFVPYSDKLRVRDLRMHGQAGLDEKLFRKFNMQLQLDIKYVIFYVFDRIYWTGINYCKEIYCCAVVNNTRSNGCRRFPVCSKFICVHTRCAH